MEQCQVAHSRSDGREIPCLLLHPKVHHRVHKSRPLKTILSQINSSSHVRIQFVMYFNVILPSIPLSPSILFSLGFENRGYKIKIIKRLMAEIYATLSLVDISN
jgi:hypothetical protein